MPLPPTVGDFIASVIGGIRDSVDQGGIRGGGSKSGGSSTVVNGIPVQAEPHDVVIAGQTFSNPGPTPVVENVGGQTFTVLPNDGGVIVPGGQTITPAGSAPTPGVSAFSTTVVDGIPVTIGASEIIVSGSTFAVGAGTTPRIITIGSETITIGGTAGAIFPSVTVPPLSFQGSPMTTTIDGVVITIEPSDAIISGITYAFSAPTSVVINGETISIGPNGVGFPTTTIPVPAPTIQSGGAAFNPPITKLWTATIVAIVTALAYI